MSAVKGQTDATRGQGGEPCGSSGTMSRMTPTFDESDRARLASATALADPLTDVLNLYFVATCHRCSPDLGEPFGTADERDAHAVGHALATGHVVHLTVEIDGEPLGEHTSAVIEVDVTSGWYFTCTDPRCERRNGKFDSGQLALASLRAHTTKATA
jgi:hypothetical protein